MTIYPSAMGATLPPVRFKKGHSHQCVWKLMHLQAWIAIPRCRGFWKQVTGFCSGESSGVHSYVYTTVSLQFPSYQISVKSCCSIFTKRDLKGAWATGCNHSIQYHPCITVSNCADSAMSSLRLPLSGLMEIAWGQCFHPSPCWQLLPFAKVTISSKTVQTVKPTTHRTSIVFKF